MFAISERPWPSPHAQEELRRVHARETAAAQSSQAHCRRIGPSGRVSYLLDLWVALLVYSFWVSDFYVLCVCLLF